MNDTLWITNLQIYVPESVGKTKGEEVSKTYIGVYQAYQEFNTLFEEEEKTPEEMKMDSDEMAAHVVAQLLESGTETSEIQFLVDCRSSITGKVPAPTYKVAVLNHIKSVIPISIQGQGGTEAVQALVIMKDVE